MRMRETRVDGSKERGKREAEVEKPKFHRAAKGDPASKWTTEERDAPCPSPEGEVSFSDDCRMLGELLL